MYLNLLIFLVTIVDSARILVTNLTPSYSHQIVIQPIVKELSKRGHEVVFATTHPLRDKNLNNLKEIDLGSPKTLRKVASSPKPGLFNMLFDLVKLFIEMSDEQLNHPEMQQIIRNKTEHFDLVMVEYSTPTLFAFKVRFNCPIIGYLSYNAVNDDHNNFGNFDNPVMYPDTLLHGHRPTSFMQRIHYVFTYLVFNLHRKFVAFAISNEIIRTRFGEDYPDISTVFKDTDMLFIVSNVMLSIIRPITPSTVMIGGGIHIRGAEILPKTIQTFLDNSKRGMVYISFGSNVESSKLPSRVLEMFLKTISQLPYDFLWKFEEENLPNKPDNLLLMKWVPQQDVLRHKNVKLFITQAGTQSCEEGLYYEVPMLAIPFFSDQQYNAHQIAEKKIGLQFDSIYKITHGELKYAIVELLENSTFKENIKKAARIIKDEPMKPVDKAIWWTEYVLRHKGAKHLKGPVVPFYQRYLLDVFLFVLFLFVLLGYIIFKFFKYIYYIRKVTLMQLQKKSA